MIILRQTTEVFAFIFLLFSISGAQSSIYRLEAGTKIRVKMDVEVNSSVAAKNDTFTVKTDQPIKNGETVLVPAGTVIEARVIETTAAASGGKAGRLIVRFEKMMLGGGETRSIEALRELRGESSQKSSLLAVVGGTAIGALIGAVAKSGTGALIGAGIGAGAGTGIALARKGKNVRIKTGEVFEIVLAKEVVLPVKDF
jgi:hypothetical protein